MTRFHNRAHNIRVQYTIGHNQPLPSREMASKSTGKSPAKVARPTRNQAWPVIGASETLAERAYQIVRDRILASALSPLTYIREEELATAMGVSRTPVREALSRLASEGFLERLPHRGFRVAERSIDELADVFTVLQALEKRYDAGYPEPSSTFTWWLGDVYSSNFGPKRSLRLNPFKTYMAKGVIWANGSDLPVAPFPARYGIWATVAREPLLGAYAKDPFGRQESVDVHAALRSHTIWAAHQMFLEKKIGSVEVGKYADLAVWDRDMYTVPTAQLKDMQCELTIFNGKIVYRAPNSQLQDAK